MSSHARVGRVAAVAAVAAGAGLLGLAAGGMSGVDDQLRAAAAAPPPATRLVVLETPSVPRPHWCDGDGVEGRDVRPRI